MGGIRRDDEPRVRAGPIAREADADARVPHLRLVPEGAGRLLASSTVLAEDPGRLVELVTPPDRGPPSGEAA